MRNIARRIKKLESAWTPAETPQSIQLQARLDVARRRIGEDEPGEGMRLQVPPSLWNARENASLGARLALARARTSRQVLYDDYQAVTSELAEGASDAERSHAESRAANLQRNCERAAYPSTAAFLQNCREQGWLAAGAPSGVRDL